MYGITTKLSAYESSTPLFDTLYIPDYATKDTLQALSGKFAVNLKFTAYAIQANNLPVELKYQGTTTKLAEETVAAIWALIDPNNEILPSNQN